MVKMYCSVIVVYNKLAGSADVYTVLELAGIRVAEQDLIVGHKSLIFNRIALWLLQVV